MSNKEISNQFTLLSKLLDIHGEDLFRAKTYAAAAYRISQLPVDLQSIPESAIYKLAGIGESIGQKISEILSSGSMTVLTDLLERTPPGVLEMMKVKGLGPKKINAFWKNMQIESVGELLYACQENRLLLYKGFGKKTQDNVLASVEYYLRHLGNFLYAQLEKTATQLTIFFKELFSTEQIHLTGDFLRQAETADRLEFVVPLSHEIVKQKLTGVRQFELQKSTETSLLYTYLETLTIEIHPAPGDRIAETIFLTAGPKVFTDAFLQRFPRLNLSEQENERSIFESAGVPFISPFLRDADHIISIAVDNKIPDVIQPEDIRGIIHCHSNWSDGSNTIEDLALACIKSGKEYLVLSDHSKSANYAQGLWEDRIHAQHEAIEELNERLSPFRIFKSIESDILTDGRLDYADNILSTFDLVIASIHANLKMDEEKATKRLLTAIENPYTAILGHMTGRLLLSRPGYPLDYRKIIDACAANNVVIEINANPRRLDMRWQWIPYALSKKVLLSINPDAHSIPEFDNTRYGVLAAQKAMVKKMDNLSSFSLSEFERFLSDRKK